MIIDFMISMLATVSRACLDVTPVVSFPNNGWAADLAIIVHAENAFNAVLPIEAIMVCLAFSMVYLSYSFYYAVAMWWYDHVTKLIP